MVGAPGCPSIDSLKASGLHAPVFVHEISRCRAGAALEYLAAVREEWLPVLADHAHTLVGLYEVFLTDREVCTIWATDPAAHCELMRAMRRCRRPHRPMARSCGEFLTDWREELMTPHPATFLSAGDPL